MPSAKSPATGSRRSRTGGTSSARSTPKRVYTTPAKRKRLEEESSVYDDYDGAHNSRSPAKRSKRSLLSAPNITLSSPAKATLKLRTYGKRSQQLRQTSPQTEATAEDRSRSAQQDTENEETPRSRRASTRTATTNGTTTRRRIRPDEEENGVAEVTVSTPSRKKKGRDDDSRKVLNPSKAIAKSSQKRRQAKEISIFHDQDLLDEQLQREESALATPRRKAGGRKKPMPKTSLTKKLLEVDNRQEQEETRSLDLRTSTDQPPLETPVIPSRITKPAIAGTKDPTSESVEQDAFTLCKRIILERVTGARPGPLVGLDEEYAKVYQVVLNTVVAGEGNSLLLIGARGSGKTAVVRKALSELSKEHADNFYAIHLNGFIHTDDKIALKEIWRQLGREMEVDDDGKNYADTLLKLLAVLSHPEESGTADPDKVAKAVIFVMDEFDLFASHPRQTLLYNLFDIAQSRKAPIAVLGLTTRIDVGESLEKRVKSRFSHRYVHTSLPKSVSMFQELCKSTLSIQPQDLSEAERNVFDQTPQTPKKTKSSTTGTRQDLPTAWNSFIEALFTHPTFHTRTLLPTYHLTKSLPMLLSTLHIPLASLEPASFPPDPSAFISSLAPLTPPDSKLHLLPSLSHLALALLIAAARLDIITDAPTCNFNMAFAEYVALASRARIAAGASGAKVLGAGSRVWGREVARREWERLVDVGLVMTVVSGAAAGGLGGGVGGGGGTGGGAIAGTTMCRCDVSLEEIGGVVRELGVDRVVEGWCRQI